jgi:hypothetical protein
MNEHPSQPELDDELLSAYIDNELSADQRAAVEARLAADPSAQRMLEHLRAVSQSVQGLPQENVGRDLSESVLRRISETNAANKHPVKDEDSFGPGDVMPKITIFRTTRGWVWASLAVAAALLIMILQANDDRKNNLGPLAQRSGGEAAKPAVNEEAQRVVGNEPAPSASSKLPAAAPVPASPPRDAFAAADKVSRTPASAAGELGTDSMADRSPGTALGRGATLGAGLKSDLQNGSAGAATPAALQPATEELADQAKAGRSKVAASAPAATTASSGPAADISHDGLVVVRVVAKRAALHDKKFDQLLATHGINIEPDLPMSLQRETKSAQVAAAESQPEQRVERLDESAPKLPSTDSVDLVFVEAPTTTIASCLDGLARDDANFVGIQVDESGATEQRLKKKEAPEKKLAENLAKYNRGTVSQQQKEIQRYLYYDEADRNRRANDNAYGITLGTANQPRSRQYDGERSRFGTLADSIRSRARRAMTQNESGAYGRTAFGGQVGPESAARGPAPAAAPKARVTQEDAKQPASDGEANLQVLFVVSPEEPAASSAPAEKSAK